MYLKCSFNGPGSLPGQVHFNKISTSDVDVRVGVDFRVGVVAGLQWGLRLKLRVQLGLGLSCG